MNKYQYAVHLLNWEIVLCEFTIHVLRIFLRKGGKLL